MKSELPPRFSMQLTLEREEDSSLGKLEFYPPKSDLVEVVVNIGKAMANSLSTIPTGRFEKSSES